MQNSIKKGDTIVVWFSCGAASAVVVKETIEKYGSICNIRVVNNPVDDEHIDNERFLKDVENWLDIKIETAINPKYTDCSIQTVWETKKYVSGIHGAPCTTELKKKARQNWENNNRFDWLVLGFTKDEVKRYENFKMFERENILPVLIDSNLSKQDCYRILLENNIKLPKLYELGFPNNNCIGCCKATSPTYWNLVRDKFPLVFKRRAELSRKLGCKLVRVKGVRKFLDELKVTDKGNKLKDTFTCGIFCETKI